MRRKDVTFFRYSMIPKKNQGADHAEGTDLICHYVREFGKRSVIEKNKRLNMRLVNELISIYLQRFFIVFCV